VPEAAREPGIVRAGPAEFEVDGDLLRKALEGGLERVGQPRLLPEHENGQVKGIRVFGVTHDTLLGILGIEDGDSIRSVNGFDMTRPESALEAYARLRTASDLTVKVSRHGSIVTMHYHLI
jgi:general secretion pathway protein C